jgi:pyridoxal/pyridoxine/pyridoxamine kinase
VDVLLVTQGHRASTEDEEDDTSVTLVTKDELSCPISMLLMTDPVVADDGHTYQREAIEEWIKKCTDGGKSLRIIICAFFAH